MAKSKYVHSEDDGRVSVRGPDGAEVRLTGMQRMHFYRLTGATPEEATDEQVERYFALRAQEEQTGQRATEILKNESATDMVTRELRILNLPQVVGGDEATGATSDPFTPPPAAPSIQQGPPAPGASQAVSPTSAARPRGGGGLGPAPRYRSGEGLPPPRYQPGAQRPAPSSGNQGTQPASVPAAEPASRFVRREGDVLYLQSPDGTEQRVTQYVRVHFLRMLEKEITQATDEDIEMWWKLQGTLDAGTSLPEAQSQSLLTEAMKAAGKLRRGELEVLQQTISAWLEARREDDGGG